MNIRIDSVSGFGTVRPAVPTLPTLPSDITSEQARKALTDTYNRYTEPELNEIMAPFRAGPMRVSPDNSFTFSEQWEKGDSRFGPENYTVRFGWISWPKENCFRLTISVDRFCLTLPYVADGIK